MASSIIRAIRNARQGLVIVTSVYFVTVSGGDVMVHRGNGFALTYRDSLVARAHHADPAALADDRGSHATAALIDFSRSLGMAAVPETFTGLRWCCPSAWPRIVAGWAALSPWTTRTGAA